MIKIKTKRRFKTYLYDIRYPYAWEKMKVNLNSVLEDSIITDKLDYIIFLSNRLFKNDGHYCPNCNKNIDLGDVEEPSTTDDIPEPKELAAYDKSKFSKSKEEDEVL